MQLVKKISDLKVLRPLGVAIGNFDGVHFGHQCFLLEMIRQCRRGGLDVLLITFLPHPLEILSPEPFYLLSSYEEKRQMLERLGVDHLLELPFTRDFSSLSPKLFMDQVLFAIPNIRKIFLGHDFSFGANRAGTIEDCKQRALRESVDIIVQDQFLKEGQRVSSSMIRDALFQGDVQCAQGFLDRPYSLCGRVIKGDGRGRTIHFPTANLEYLPKRLTPRSGVYVTKTTYGNSVFQSVTNIGRRPTFKDSDPNIVETHLFDFDKDIYGEEIKIEFFSFLRGEKKFSSANELILQIREDVNKCQKYFEDHP